MTTPALPVFVNREGGWAAAQGDAAHAKIAAAFAGAGAQADIAMLAPDAIADAVARAARAHARIVVAGGDGTIACAAQAMIGATCELALLPLGTLNHLARDLGIPADLEGAAALAAQGAAAAIDIGTVNGRRFVNNVSIGLYPFMVRERDAVRRLHGWPKWLASIPASWQALARFRHHRLRIDLGTGEQPLLTPLLFVGNNHYSLDAGSVGSRASLRDGRLAVYAVARRSRGALIWFALRALAGRVDPVRDFVALDDVAAFRITAHGGSIEVAMDGETERLESPLDFAIEPGALRVVTPPDA